MKCILTWFTSKAIDFTKTFSQFSLGLCLFCGKEVGRLHMCIMCMYDVWVLLPKSGTGDGQCSCKISGGGVFASF